MMQIISDIYEKIFPALTAGPNVSVQFDWSTSVILEDREGGYPNSENKVPKKQRKLSTPFLSSCREPARNSVLDRPRLITLGRR